MGSHTLCLGEKLLGQVACYNHLPSLLLLNVLSLVEVQGLGLVPDILISLAVAARNGQGVVFVIPI
jgi:hypothetical protein